MITVSCDGCACTIAAETTPVGRLEPCVFCLDCLATWRAAEAAITAAHVRAVEVFEAERAQILARTRGTIRGTLMRLPDE